jgi:hypothetical protein
MASWEPYIVQPQYTAWVASFHERFGASPAEVLNGVVVAGDAAYAEAYGAWLTQRELFSQPQLGAL